MNNIIYIEDDDEWYESGWYHRDETEDLYGPYPTQTEAEEALVAYYVRDML